MHTLPQPLRTAIQGIPMPLSRPQLALVDGFELLRRQWLYRTRNLSIAFANLRV